MSNAAKTTADQPSLIRVLGLRIATAVVVGNVIGSGIFFKPSTIAATAGNFWVILPIWVLGGLLCILGALCFAELAAMIPRAGGLYVYLREAYGRPIAFLFGWTEFAVRVPGSIAALSVVFVSELINAFRWEASVGMELTIICGVIISLAILNILGVFWGGAMQMVTTVIKASVLALIAAAPIFLAPWAADGIDTANYGTTIQPGESSVPMRIGIVLLSVMWAYNGWHGVTPLAEEVRQPQRNLPLSLFVGIGILIALYLAANFAYHGVLSMDEMRQIELKNEQAAGAVVKANAASEMLNKLIGPVGLTIVAAVIMCSTFGAINTNLLQAPRITFAMGRDGVFFSALGKVHATRRTPAAAIAATALMSILFVLLVAASRIYARKLDVDQFSWEMARKVVSGLQTNTVFNMLTDCVIFAASVFYTLTVFAVIVLRIRRPDQVRPYRTWGFPITPLLFIVVYLWFLSQVYLDKPLEAHTGLVVIAAGIPVYLLFRRRA